MRREDTDYAKNMPTSEPRRQLKKSRRTSLIALVSITIITIVTIVTGSFLYLNRVKSPVPKNISQAVNFTVYYPDAKKLPEGYALNTSSFSSPEKDVVLYSINYASGKKILVSAQKRPSDDDIQSFYANYIPLRNQMQTNLGKAEIGAYGSDKNLKTVVSLPTKKGTWLIITTPYDINQNQLKQILNSLRK